MIAVALPVEGSAKEVVEYAHEVGDVVLLSKFTAEAFLPSRVLE